MAVGGQFDYVRYLICEGVRQTVEAIGWETGADLSINNKIRSLETEWERRFFTLLISLIKSKTLKDTQSDDRSILFYHKWCGAYIIAIGFDRPTIFSGDTINETNLLQYWPTINNNTQYMYADIPDTFKVTKHIGLIFIV